MASTTASPSTARDDRELARLAMAGDGEAFARLYDRHERRVYGFCLRMLGSEDEAAEATQETFMRLLRRLPALQGRELNFVAYALGAARNACYDTIEARRRVTPVGEPIETGGSEPGELALDPERAALLAATRAAVRKANAELPDRQREVLALRELEQLSYEQIGEIVGLNSNAVAQLISRARIKLRDLVRGGALESIAASSPDCERALPLLARLQDDQGAAADDLDWLRAHVAGCETCSTSRAAMEEAGVSYRALGPIVVLAWLRHATIARAAELVGADWSHVADSAPGAHAAPPTSKRPMRLTGMRALADRRRLWPLLSVGVLCAITVVALAGSITREHPVSVQSVTSVSRVVRPIHRRSTQTRAPLAQPQVVAVGGAAAGAANGLPLSVSVPTPQPARTHRRAGKRGSKHRVQLPPATSPSAPPPTPQPQPQPQPQPATTTPTATTPPPSPPSAEPSGGSTTTSTTPSPETPGKPGEGGHSCTLAIAC